MDAVDSTLNLYRPHHEMNNSTISRHQAKHFISSMTMAKMSTTILHQLRLHMIIIIKMFAIAMELMKYFAWRRKIVYTSLRTGFESNWNEPIPIRLSSNQFSGPTFTLHEPRDKSSKRPRPENLVTKSIEGKIYRRWDSSSKSFTFLRIEYIWLNKIYNNLYTVHVKMFTI